MDVIQQIKGTVSAGMLIPKPAASGPFTVKGWGKRRGEEALIYLIPNHRNPQKPHEKGVTISEFRRAHSQLLVAGEFTRTWFIANLAECANEGSCNFTTIGGIFELLGLAQYVDRGAYRRKS